MRLCVASDICLVCYLVRLPRHGLKRAMCAVWIWPVERLVLSVYMQRRLGHAMEWCLCRLHIESDHYRTDSASACRVAP